MESGLKSAEPGYSHDVLGLCLFSVGQETGSGAQEMSQMQW